MREGGRDDLYKMSFFPKVRPIAYLFCNLSVLRSDYHGMGIVLRLHITVILYISFSEKLFVN
jgi:hypothetical protein